MNFCFVRCLSIQFPIHISSSSVFAKRYTSIVEFFKISHHIDIICGEQKVNILNKLSKPTTYIVT